MEQSKPHPARIGPFRVARRIASGGMGTVYLCTDGTERRLAVKLLDAELDADGEAERQFRNEARAAARLGHDGVVELFDYGVDARRPWLAMELLAGGPLRAADVGSAEDLVLVLDQVLVALAHAHSRGVVHRDLKPGNLLKVGHELRAGIKVCDFGIAWTAENEPESKASGTLRFMAPEQVAKEWWRYGPSTDLFALGCVAMTLTVGERLYDGKVGLALVQAKLAAPPALVEPRFELPAPLMQWMERMVQLEPGDRFASAALARRALHRALGRELAVPTEVHNPTPRPALPGAGLALFGLRCHPFEGRREQRQRLWDALRAAASGSCKVVTVQGVSGAGKSALARWLREEAEAHGVAMGWTLAGDEPVRSAVVDHLGVRGLSGADLHKVLCARLEDPILLRTVARVVGRSANRGERAAAFWHLLEASGPAVVVVEDAHQHADVLRLVRRIVREEEPPPVLFLVLYRPESLAENPRAATEIEGLNPEFSVELTPAPRHERRLVLDSWLRLSPTLSAQIDEQSAGVPGRALRLVEAYVESDALVATPDGFRADGEVQLGVDAGWQERIAHHLTGLDETGWRDLEVAAALGPVVVDDAWFAACDGDPSRSLVHVARRAKLVDRLVRRGLAQEMPQGWRFVHPAIRQVFAERAADRWTAHLKAAARALAELDPAQAAALHLEAGEPRLAVHGLLDDLVQRSRKRGRHAAMAVLPSALEAMQAVPADSPLWVRMERYQSHLERQAGHLLAAKRHAEQSSKLALQLGDQAGWALGQYEYAMALQLGGELREALAMHLATVEALETMGPAAPMVGQMLFHAAIAAQMLARTNEAYVLCERAAEWHLAHDEPNRAWVCRCRSALMIAEEGRLEEAHASLRSLGEVLEEQTGEDRLRYLDSLAPLLRAMGRAEEAIGVLEQAMVVARKTGRSTHISQINLALCELTLGRVDDAGRRAERLEPRLREQSPVMAAVASVIRLQVDAKYGRWEAMSARWNAASQTLIESGFRDPDVGWLVERLADTIAEHKPSWASKMYGYAIDVFDALDSSRSTVLRAKQAAL